MVAFTMVSPAPALPPVAVMRPSGRPMAVAIDNTLRIMFVLLSLASSSFISCDHV